MISSLAKYFVVILIVAITLQKIYGWGFWGHKKINKIAVFTLPSEMIGFYKKHIDFIEEHSIDADKRRYVDKHEAICHYIDLDHYNNLPQKWDSAVSKFSEDTLLKYGILPWHINKTFYSLTEALKTRDVKRILRLSADLGHYIGDAHVPLHTTENYNGQLTNQHGIHGFWESRVPELFGDNYTFFTGRAKYIENPLVEIWKVILESHAAVDSVLLFEKQVNEKFPPDRKYAYVSKGSNTVRAYSKEYASAYDALLNNMIERRMRSSVHMVGNFWYTAWINAGKPDLLMLEENYAHDEQEELLKDQLIFEPVKGHIDE